MGSIRIVAYSKLSDGSMAVSDIYEMERESCNRESWKHWYGVARERAGRDRLIELEDTAKPFARRTRAQLARAVYQDIQKAKLRLALTRDTFRAVMAGDA